MDTREPCSEIGFDAVAGLPDGSNQIHATSHDQLKTKRKFGGSSFPKPPCNFS